MPDVVSVEYLQRLNSSFAKSIPTIERYAHQKENKDTFLSHSSKDKHLIPAVIQVLEDHGASVYCDLDDKRMPDKPSSETARIIKGQIRESKKLVVFVTVNSKGSSWVPWELGMGDAILDKDQVVLFPAANVSGDKAWVKQEYLGLYPQVQQEGEKWVVFRPQYQAIGTVGKMVLIAYRFRRQRPSWR